MTFFISVGAWASLPHFFAAFIPFVSLGVGRCAEEDGSLPFAFGSLCARLAVSHFRIKSNLNTDGRVHSPLAGSKRFYRFGYN